MEAPSLPPAPPPRTLMPVLGDWALFLDFDGTLVDLAASPDAIQVPQDLPALLRALNECFAGALAILTGRALGDLDRHLPDLAIAAAGQHGAERRLAAGATAPIESGAVAAARPELVRFAARHPGVLVEDKGASIALHYRTAPAAEPAIAALAESLVAASGGALEALAGKAVRELRPAGTSKGGALHAFLSAAPFAGRRPLVIGDDVTDEAAFAAAREARGAAIKVGAGASRASWWLRDSHAVRAWLGRMADSGKSARR